MRNIMSALCAACFVISLSGCANLTAVDKPLAQWTPDVEKNVTRRIADNRSGDLLVLLAFSGGGTRAASFAYGALKELAATKITTENGEKSLLHEIDVISSVSGGSFTSAYFGLRGDGIFNDFEERFLRKNVQGALMGQVFNPINWARLLSGSYGTSDLAARYYDKILFDKATFSDLNRPGAPLIVINTTDLTTGIRFPFDEWMFNLICADLNQYPLSRAVAASSAVPIIFSPVTIKSFAGSCGYEYPEWLDKAKKDLKSTVRKLEIDNLEDYFDVNKRPYMHLVDGGISDNLGLRTYYNTVSLLGDPHLAFEAFGHPNLSQILIISVNSHAKPKSDWGLERTAPSLAHVIDSISATQIDRYSADTLDIVRYAYNKWVKDVSTPDHPVTLNFVEVNFTSVKDETEREFLNNIGTSFDLKDEEVDHLISAAGEVLHESPEFQAFLKRNQGGKP